MKKFLQLSILVTLISSQSFAQMKKPINNQRDGIICKVMTGNSPTNGSAARRTTDLVSTNLLMKENESETVIVPFKTLSGEARPLTLKLKRIHVSPNNSLFLLPGGDYSFNNPFEANSIFSRNDITGKTVVSGSNFVFEGEQNAKKNEAFLNTLKQQTFFSPYLIIKMTPNSPTSQLVTPKGQVTNAIVMVCVVSDDKRSVFPGESKN